MVLAREGRGESVLDASVLINFLKIDRCDLLGAHPRCAFVAPPEVLEEITTDYPYQCGRRDAAIAEGHLGRVAVRGPAELEIFSRLRVLRLGVGECAAITVAVARKLPIALQDGRARKKALKHCPVLEILTTQSIIVDLIACGCLDVREADLLKDNWRKLRFDCGVQTFAQLLRSSPSNA